MQIVREGTDLNVYQKPLLEEIIVKTFNRLRRIIKALRNPDNLTSVQKDFLKTHWGVSSDRELKLLADCYTKIQDYISRMPPIKNGEEASCGPTDFGYAYPGNEAQGIYLCPYFYTIDKKGEDSQMGTLVHEASHIVLNTEDHEYGVSGDKKLRTNLNKSKLKSNADTYEHFFELFKME